MKQSLRIGAIALTIAATVIFETRAQGTGDTDWQDVELLKGRLIISAPPGTEVVPNEVANIMAAAPSDEMTTKLSVPLSPTKNDIVVYVREHFALFPQDPEAYFRDNLPGGILEDKNAPPRGRQLDSRLRAYGAFEGQRQHPSGNHVLADVLVAQMDGTTQEVFIMSWDERAETLERYSEIALRMINSLRPGPREKLETGGQHLIEASLRDGRSLRFTVDLPDGYTFAEEPGPDFTVYRIGRLAPMDAPAGALGIYVGWHPSMIHQRNRIPSEQLKEWPLRLLDQDTKWIEHRESDTAGPDWVYREALLPLEDDSVGAKAHFFLAAPDGSGEIERLSQIVETQMKRVEP